LDAIVALEFLAGLIKVPAVAPTYEVKSSATVSHMNGSGSEHTAADQNDCRQKSQSTVNTILSIAVSPERLAQTNYPPTSVRATAQQSVSTSYFELANSSEVIVPMVLFN